MTRRVRRVRRVASNRTKGTASGGVAGGAGTAPGRSNIVEGAPEDLAHPLGGPPVEVVGGEDTVDHVALDLRGLTPGEANRDDGPTGKPADGAVGVTAAGRAAERRHDQARCPRRALELTRTLCEQDRPGPHVVTMAGV